MMKQTSAVLGNRYHKGPNWINLCRGGKLTKYLFWLLIAFLAGLTIRDVIQLCAQFADDPKQTEFKMIFNESMVMPNLTICISKEQAYSHFNLRNLSSNATAWDLIVQENLANMTDRESFLNNTWDSRIAIEAYEVIAALSSMERETTAHGLVHAISSFRTNPAFQEKRKLVQVLNVRKISVAVTQTSSSLTY
ncbi:unnamed protein product [Gongylonema pulchrum]|uniref:Acid-sensing ion channel 1-like n=1 Tax=Gongylonema pulchrum TaxID=637853 RepID=A0A183ETL6_9BILA|nr:unnamed protein product [Gongylonema pulchrum]